MSSTAITACVPSRTKSERNSRASAIGRPQRRSRESVAAEEGWMAGTAFFWRPLFWRSLGLRGFAAPAAAAAPCCDSHGCDFVWIRTALACAEIRAPRQVWQGVTHISFSSIRRMMLLLALRQRLASIARMPSNFVFAPRSARPRRHAITISSMPVPLSQIFFSSGVSSCHGVSSSLPGASFRCVSAWAATPLSSRRSHRGMSRKVPSTPIAPLRSDFSGAVRSLTGSMP